MGNEPPAPRHAALAALGAGSGGARTLVFARALGRNRITQSR